MTKLRSFACDRAGATAAEFAMVVPVLILFLFGMIDVGRYMWTLNQAEKATQMGVRFAVVTDPVANVLNQDFAAAYNLVGGDAVPVGTFNAAVCTSSGNCTVTGGASGANSRNATAFTSLVTWMQKFYPTITASNVWITYKNVGLGFAGDPNGPDVAALTTVELRNLTFQPLILFGGALSLPPIKAMLTLEDAECSEDDGDPLTEEETNCGFSN